MHSLKYRCYAATLLAVSQAIIESCDASTTHMYVANQLSQGVSVIDAKTQEVVHTVYGFVRPFDVAWDGATGVYVTDIRPYPGRVVVIDTVNYNLSEISGPFNSPWLMALDGGTGMYVANEQGSTVTIIDTQTGAIGGVVSLPGAIPGVMAWDGGSGMYVVDSFSPNLYVINVDTMQVTDSIPLAFVANDVAWDGGTGMYVCLPSGGQIDVINTQTKAHAGSIHPGYSPGYAAWDGGTGMYVTDAINAVHVINTRTLQPVSAPITVGDGPLFLAWDGATGMYSVSIGELVNSPVSVIDTQTFQVVNTIKQGNFPTGIARAVLTPPPVPVSGEPLLVVIELSKIGEGALQLPQGAPVSLFGKAIADISQKEMAQILVMRDNRVIGTVTVDFLTNTATSDNPAVLASIVQDVDAGVAVLNIEMIQ